MAVLPFVGGPMEVQNPDTTLKPLSLTMIVTLSTGILTAACANQAPGLFGCVITIAGLFDMLRVCSCVLHLSSKLIYLYAQFPKFTFGAVLRSEYGDVCIHSQCWPGYPLINIPFSRRIRKILTTSTSLLSVL